VFGGIFEEFPALGTEGRAEGAEGGFDAKKTCVFGGGRSGYCVIAGYSVISLSVAGNRMRKYVDI